MTDKAVRKWLASDSDEDEDSSSSSSSSHSNSFSAEVLAPRLNEDVLLEIAQYLDVKTLKAGRLVNAEWNAAFSMEFRKKAILVPALTFEKSVDKFVEMFSPNPKIIAENVWFQKQKFLKSNSMIKWMEECGAQIKSGKLGNPLDEKDFRTEGSTKLTKKVFSIEVISSFLDQCPNLESLTIVAPFTSSQASFEPKIKATLELDYLEIGSNSNNRRAFRRRWFLGSSCLLMNTLNCLKSVKILSIVNMARYNFDGIRGRKDDSAKAVLERVTELSLEHSMVDPCQLFSLAAPYVQFQNLQKLKIASFCGCNEAGQYLHYVNLGDLLSSVRDQLVELIFDQCSNKTKMKCSKLEECFPTTTTMSKLEVFKILGITEWKNPSLEFLKQLPELKVLHVSKASSISGLPRVDNLFRRRNPRLTVSHKNLKELVFRCGTETSTTFSGIVRSFPNLRTLESDFYGKNLKPVFTVLKKEGRVKNLKLFVYVEFECDYFKMLAISGIKKLCLEYGKRTHKLTVSLPSSENLSFLKSSVLREFNFVGMKFVKDEYELLKKKLTKSKSKMKLRLFGCDVEAEDPAIEDSDDDSES